MSRRPSPATIVAKVERWLSDETEISSSAIIARKLATREPVDLAAFTSGLNVSGSLASLAMGDMRTAGYVFTTKQQSRDGMTRVIGYSVPKLRDLSQNSNGKPEPAKTTKVVAANGKPSHPMVGGKLTVRAVVLNDAGSLEIMGVDQDGHAWQLAIVGTA